MAIETIHIKVGQHDAFHNLFFAETLDGSLQVAHSDKIFFSSGTNQTPDEQGALNDLVAKLEAKGWQQVVGTIPSPWYNLKFQREVNQTPTIETSLVKLGQHDAFHNLFFAETLDGSLQVAHSDKIFFSSGTNQTPDEQAALNDLVAKLEARGWQQVTGGIPTPWYSLKFQREVFQTPQNP